MSAAAPTPRARLVRPLRELLRRDRWARRLLLAGAGLGLVVVALLWPYLASGGDIGAGLEHQPSRLYARPLEVAVGDVLRAADLIAHLRAMGYRETAHQRLEDGRFRREERRVEAALRRRFAPHGEVPPQRLAVTFEEGAVRALTLDDAPVDHAFVGAPLLASYYGPDARETWPVRVEELPDHVVDAVLAAEDRGFFRHPGVSPSGIARAALVNVRAGDVAQGGSTITQQLVKNVYLSHERTVGRKLREVPLALVVEAGHGKDEILQAYLNQIYLGGGDGVSIHGIGAAARAYFAKDARDLTLAEAALLAGMIHNPAGLMPTRHPEAARARRDTVLERMAEREMISPAALESACREPVTTEAGGLGGRRARHFAVAAAAEARTRFGLARLGGRGYQLFSTLSWRDQLAAEAAVAEGLAALGDGELEAALVSVDPANGGVRAYVGGRDWATSEFDRVRLARRQPGSVFKPIVVAAALAAGETTPATLLRDAPLTVESGGRTWSPRNDDGRFLGWVTLRRAIEDSRNVPIARLAQDVGLEEVAAMGERLGLEAAPEPLPAMALGAFEASPWEIATVYSTLAAGGLRPTLHTLTAVVGGDGEAIAGEALAEPEPALDPRIAYLTNHLLEGVVDRGTGRGVRRYDVSGALAGKTGTSNGARDNWFAGYRPDRVTVVWVGHDEPRSTGLSGARAALPLWGRFSRDALPAGSPDRFAVPPGLVHARVCRDSGRLARRQCPVPVAEAFLAGQAPSERCHLHQVIFRRHRPGDRREQGKSWLERKLEDIFDF